MPPAALTASRTDALLWSRLLAGRLSWQMGGGTVRVLRVRWNQHAPRADRTRPHRHPFHQILYYSQGRGMQYLGEGRRPVEVGSICFVPAGVLHSFVGTGRRPATCLTMDLDMEDAVGRGRGEAGAGTGAGFVTGGFRHAAGQGPEHDDGWVLRHALDEGQRHVFPVSARFQRQVAACMARINREVEARQTGYATAVQGMLLELLALFLRATRGTPVFARGYPVRRWRNATVVRRAVALADDLPDAALSISPTAAPTLAQAAREMGVSANHLNVLLRQQTGLTFRQLLIQRRIESAKTLLRVGDDRCTEIAHACGFGDSNYFARLFRRKTGMTPGEFRRKAR
jgi:AraC-like DNA-binding protein/mannose-6-phosphate isomerase-like protein (cupin superfamily)